MDVQLLQWLKNDYKYFNMSIDNPIVMKRLWHIPVVRKKDNKKKDRTSQLIKQDNKLL